MQNIDDFIDQGRQNMRADSDRLTAAAFQNIYDQGIKTLANGEPIDPEDQRSFEQACGFWGKSPDDVQTDVTAAKAKKQAQATVDRAGSIHAKSAYIDAMFRAAGISPLRDTPGYRDSLSAQMQEVESELVMLRQAEALLAGHESMDTSTTVDGLPDAVCLHEASHCAVGVALGGRLETLSVSTAGGICIFAEGVDNTIGQAAVMLSGGVGVGHF